MQTKNKRRSRGLGDTVEKVLQATGIDKVAKFIAGEDCGCEERKAKLNELFPYKQPLCLQEEEYNYLTEFYTNKPQVLRPTQAKRIFEIYDRVFQVKQPTNTGCDSCVRRIVNELEQLTKEYEKEVL